MAALTLSKEGVRSKSSAAWPGRAIANHIPRKVILRDPLRQIGAIFFLQQHTHLVLPFPVDDILDLAQTTHVDIFARFHEHVRGRHDERQGWFARVLACQPYCDRDVVRSLAIGYG